uniref:Uncharacterized protein n=1 Tax=Lactuca sativa TaxID=4236 RepID=A0A9R1WUE8_LACSA|nr:hypothetical protein LSAT_V11C800444670 [Lactuca sativa]
MKLDYICMPFVISYCALHLPLLLHRPAAASITFRLHGSKKKLIGRRGIPQELLGQVVLRGLARGLAGSLISLSVSTFTLNLS